MVDPVDPPGLPPVGGTPPLSRVRGGTRREEGAPRRKKELEEVEKDEEPDGQDRKGRNVDERC